MVQGELARIKLTCFKSDVYEPSDDSFLLADTILELAKTWNSGWPKISLEIGSGSGYVLCSLALTLQRLGTPAPLLFATDLNPSAAEATAATLKAHGVRHTTDILLTDLVSGLSPRIDGLIDLLIFNPPYVVTPDEEVTRGGIAAAWAGGHRGRLVVDRLLPLIPRLLSPRGEMLMVAVPDNDPQEILEKMKVMGLEGRIAAERAADEEHLMVLHFWRQPSETAKIENKNESTETLT